MNRISVLKERVGNVMLSVLLYNDHLIHVDVLSALVR